MTADQQSASSDEQLCSVLRQWVVEAPLPPRFQERVWKRIEGADVPAAAGLWTAVFRWFYLALPRPKVAFVYVTALLLLGVAAGSLTAHAKSSRFNAALGERYVQSIDPYRAEVPQP